jgi:uncharacterized membrane protein
MRGYILQSIPILFGAGFVLVGLRHFQDPAWFEPIVPGILGMPRLWVYSSGLLEIILGLGIMTPKFRPEASILTAMMLVVLYWANLNMWVNDIPIGGSRLSTNGHIIRGLIQALMIWLALWIGDWLPSKS